MSCLLHEQNLVWIVWPFNDASEVHRVINLILSLKYFLKAEVVMTLLERIKCDVLVILGKEIAVLTARVLHPLDGTTSTS